MELYGNESKSIYLKLTINLPEILFLWLAWWILFSTGGTWVENSIGITNAPGNHSRRITIFVFYLAIFIRLGYMMFFLLKRKITPEESLSVPFAFAAYYLGFSLFVLPVSSTLNFWAYLAMILFAVGCLLNTGSELLRHQWKSDPENKGWIYTGGFFRYARHIN